jgi:hypothetical protein
LLGVTRPTLYDLLAKNQIDATQFGRSAATPDDPSLGDGSSEPREE